MGKNKRAVYFRDNFGLVEKIAIMKKLISTIILLATISVMIYGQTNNPVSDKLIISIYGDSTYFTEKYEINIKKKKVFYINPIINYLDIEEGKYKTRIRIEKQNWKEILKMSDYLNKLGVEENINIINRVNCYFIQCFTDGIQSAEFNFHKSNAPIEIKKIIEEITGSK